MMGPKVERAVVYLWDYTGDYVGEEMGLLLDTFKTSPESALVYTFGS
jgi:hypothetical protein